MRRNPFLNSRLTALAALLAGGLFLPGLAGAQSLQTLYTAARGYDATYQGALATARAAEFREQQSEALNRPIVTLQAGASTGQADYPYNSGLKNSTSANGALNGRLPLFNRANDATIEQARRQLDAAKADLSAAEQDLIVRVAQAYFDVLAAEDALTTARTSKKGIVEQLASAKRNFEVGTATITDTREAQARSDLADATELQTENDLRARRIALDTVVGTPNVRPYQLATPLPPLALQPANVEEWVSAALAQHPAVLRAQVALEVAQLETKKARAGDLPTVDAVAGVSSQDSRGNGVAFTGRTNSASVGVQLNWTLYNGNLTQNRVGETLALEDKSQSDLSAAKRGVAQNTRVAFYNFLTGQAQVRALEAAEASSKLALEATQLGYKVGVRVNLDVLNSQTQLFTTQRDLARARYNLVVSRLLLLQASGQLAPADVDVVNRLLVAS
ncbi:MAG: TolC family outer membrane protein [Pseudomonadota bacterium]|nr:TolC family outer membrane protein [Pseudomonadota bacterium]